MVPLVPGFTFPSPWLYDPASATTWPTSALLLDPSSRCFGSGFKGQMGLNALPSCWPLSGLPTTTFRTRSRTTLASLHRVWSATSSSGLSNYHCFSFLQPGSATYSPSSLSQPLSPLLPPSAGSSTPLMAAVTSSIFLKPSPVALRPSSG